ncbi:rho guanine nucleotide exchange factor 10 isoform X4 [Lepeophtheirus salmonis]
MSTKFYHTWNERLSASMENSTNNSEKRISRLFSLKKQPSIHHNESKSNNGRSNESKEFLYLTSKKSCNMPVILGSPPLNLSQESLKRRYIIQTLVSSENNYVSSLQRLVNDYKKPLEESSPLIISQSKITTLFYRISEILQIHYLFRIGLSQMILSWDSQEKIGDVFVASFSKAIVLETYSDFINNFNEAFNIVKYESKRKSALSDFLDLKQLTSSDRISLFGLLVKPVQRFPQFILILQDLLKETPPGHVDRMALQLALTTLESLAEMLNERKREAEQFAAFKEKIKSIGGKTKGLLECKDRYLLKEGDLHQLEFNSSGQISRSKARRLLLINDYIICLSMSGRFSEIDLGQPSPRRYSLKWAVPVIDIEIIDGKPGGTTLSRLLAPSTSGLSYKKPTVSNKNSTSYTFNSSTLVLSSSTHNNDDIAESLAADMNNLMHDFDTVSRINSLLSTLKGNYEGLNSSLINGVMSKIQGLIREKDEEISWLDACCFQLSFKSSKGHGDIISFQTSDPNVKHEWITELCFAQLALNTNNSPAWDVLEEERNVSAKLPLYVTSIPVIHEANSLTELTVGTSYTLLVTSLTRTIKPQTFIWVSAFNGTSSILKVLSHPGYKELSSITHKSFIKHIEFVPGIDSNCSYDNDELNLRSNLVWISTNKMIIIYSAYEPERFTEITRFNVPAEITSLLCQFDAVWIGLSNGILASLKRNPISFCWDLSHPSLMKISSNGSSINCLLPVCDGLYVSWANIVGLIDVNSLEILKSFPVKCNNEDNNNFVEFMSSSGVGLWISLKHSSTICLYHTETFRHLQDINIASNVYRVLSAREVSQPTRSIFVSAMKASKGLLWVGTNVGIALTVPLPRLEGVPIISGRANISYHSHFGPVNFFLNLNNRVASPYNNNFHLSVTSRKFPEGKIIEGNESGSGCLLLKKQNSDGIININSCKDKDTKFDNKLKCLRQLSSPIMLEKDVRRRSSKTLPPGFPLPSCSSQETDVHSLYGDLLNITNQHLDTSSTRLKKHLCKSNPDLSINSALNILNHPISRPKSLDMSSWSVESRATSSSGSSESYSDKQSPNVSRNASFLSKRSIGSRKSYFSYYHTTESPSTNDFHSKYSSSKTVVSLMGGRGYINWRQRSIDKNLSTNSNTDKSLVNNSDAYLVVWEMKI